MRKIGITIRIENVVSAEDTSLRDFESEHLHRTAVTLPLLQPWFHTNRVVCADSYFASVPTAESLYEKGLRFTGVVKTSTKKYPMKYLSHLEIAEKRKHVTLVSKPIAGPHLMAVMWVDRDRNYFISSVGTTNGGTPIYRERWRTRHGVTRKEELSIRIPSVCEQYYETCSQIDRHNGSRQDDLGLEKKFEVKEWSMRVKTSLLAICIVDAWNLYAGSKGDGSKISPNQFYCELADQLADNKYDRISLLQRESDSAVEDEDIGFGSGIGTHLTPTTRKRKNVSGEETSALYQSRCNICKSTKKSKFIYSACKIYFDKEVYLRHHQTGPDCFKTRVDERHDLTYKGKYY